jgi:hypothetical protein
MQLERLDFSFSLPNSEGLPDQIRNRNVALRETFKSMAYRIFLGIMIPKRVINAIAFIE